MDINEHQQWLVKFYEKRDWFKYPPQDRVNYITEELGELSRAVRTIEVLTIKEIIPIAPLKIPLKLLERLKTSFK